MVIVHGRTSNDLIFTVTSSASTQVDLIGSWAGQGIFDTANSVATTWNYLFRNTPASSPPPTSDNDGKDDLIGSWSDSGVWVKYSSTGQLGAAQQRALHPPRRRRHEWRRPQGPYRGLDWRGHVVPRHARQAPGATSLPSPPAMPRVISITTARTTSSAHGGPGASG